MCEFKPTLADAEKTVRSAIIMAIANTSIQTGLRADSKGMPEMVDAIVHEVKSQSVGWAFKKLSSSVIN